jgi:dihydrolipoamide dehydrogenase
MKSTDLIIIGAGPGGYETAVRAAQGGLDTVIVEGDKVGGTCLNYGCIPTKSLRHSADVLSMTKKAAEQGVNIDNYSFNIATAMERKKSVVDTLVGGVETLLRNPRITRVVGKAQFIDAHSIRVADAKDTNGENIETEYSADNIIIATGSVTKFLPIPGKDLNCVLTSTELLDIDSVPKRLCVIGGGVIGLEFASIFNDFGSEVTVLEFCKEVLPNFDSDIAKRLKVSLKAQGINIINDAMVTAIADNGNNGGTVSYTVKGNTLSVDADIVLMAVGRVANIASLNLKDVGIAIEKRGITVDDDFRTNISGIYAIGDINGHCQLAHAASFQGRHVINKLLGKADRIDFNIIPAAVFTKPEAATVGLTADYCKSNGIATKTHKAFFRANGRALTMGETDGMVKIITDEDGHILGGHIFGPHASDLIQEIATLMQFHATVSDLSDCIHAHPTLSEVVMSAAE